MFDGVSQEVPWAWYMVRSAGLVGFLLLYISVILGLMIRVPYIRKLVSGQISFQMHCWLSLLAWILALLHGSGLLFDKYLKFSFADVFVPFSSGYETNLVSLGIIGFYLMLLLVVTSYVKNMVANSFWRAVHFLNMGMYFILAIHALYLGSDMKIELVRNIFWGMQGVLVIFIILHIIARISCRVRKSQECEIQ